jgi:Flp pilus assembly protein TadD
LQQAIVLEPRSAEFRFNLGFVLESRGDFAAAVAPLQKAVELSHGKNSRFLAELARAYDKTGHRAEAVKAAQEALDRATEDHDEKTAAALRTVLEGYEREGQPAPSQ